jgi:hypothetical protein
MLLAVSFVDIFIVDLSIYLQVRRNENRGDRGGEMPCKNVDRNV